MLRQLSLQSMATNFQINFSEISGRKMILSAESYLLPCNGFFSGNVKNVSIQLTVTCEVGVIRILVLLRNVAGNMVYQI